MVRLTRTELFCFGSSICQKTENSTKGGGTYLNINGWQRDHVYIRAHSGYDFFILIWHAVKLGSVAGPVIQANGRLSFEGDLRSEACVSQVVCKDQISK